MISSVTTAVSTIVSSASLMSFGIALGTVAVLTLIAGLVIRTVSTGQKSGLALIGKNLEITILPLLIVFVSIVCTTVATILP